MCRNICQLSPIVHPRLSGQNSIMFLETQIIVIVIYITFPSSYVCSFLPKAEPPTLCALHYGRARVTPFMYMTSPDFPCMFTRFPTSFPSIIISIPVNCIPVNRRISPDQGPCNKQTEVRSPQRQGSGDAEHQPPHRDQHSHTHQRPVQRNTSGISALEPNGGLPQGLE